MARPSFWSTLYGVDGNFSFKRGFGALSFIVLCLAALASWKGHPLNDHLVDVFAWIFSVCTLGAAVDRIAGPRSLTGGP